MEIFHEPLRVYLLKKIFFKKIRGLLLVSGACSCYCGGNHNQQTWEVKHSKFLVVASKIPPKLGPFLIQFNLTTACVQKYLFIQGGTGTKKKNTTHLGTPPQLEITTWDL